MSQAVDGRDLYLTELLVRQIFKLIVNHSPAYAWLTTGFWGFVFSFVLRQSLGWLITQGMIVIDLKFIDTQSGKDQEKFDKAVEVWEEIENAKGLTDEEKKAYRQKIIDATIDFVNVRNRLRQ